MAINRTRIEAPQEEVFGILGNGATYADWVVGAKRVRSVDPAWPAPGARLHHTVGAGPFVLRDSTEVRELKAPDHLVLQANGRPLGSARVEFQLEGDGDSTTVTMIEDLTNPPRGLQPVFDAVVHLRNAETLRRLRRTVLARRRAAAAR